MELTSEKPRNRLWTGYKIWNLPLLIMIGILLGGIVTAGAVLYGYKNVITLQRPTLTTSIPPLQFASSGDYYEWGYNYTNTANQANNLTLVFNITQPTLVSGDVKLRIMDNTSTVITESSTATGGVVKISDMNRMISAGTSFEGRVSVEYNVSAPNTTYTMELALEGGDDQFR